MPRLLPSPAAFHQPATDYEYRSGRNTWDKKPRIYFHRAEGGFSGKLGFAVIAIPQEARKTDDVTETMI